MRAGPLVHGGLLAAALGFGWQTWTRDRAVPPPRANLDVWPASGAVESLTLRGTLRDVSVERRDDYYWATVKKTTPPPPRPQAPDGGVPENIDLPDQGKTTTTEFPVGEEGEKVLARLAPLKAVRDLGATAEREEYGLGDKSDKLTVKVGGAARELVLGAKVFGGDDRYVLDPAGGHVYVVAGEAMRPFDAPEFTLRERKLHAFPANDAAEVTVRSAAGKERTLVRRAKAGPEPDKPGRPPAVAWADKASPDKPDQTLANFMARVDQLAATEYGQAAEGLLSVATIEYRGKDGKAMGTTEISKKPGATAGQFEYYVKSERTRGLAKVSATAAARVDADLAEMLK